MRQFKQKFDQAGVQVVLITMGTVEQNASFKNKFDLPFPMVSDPKRSLYDTYKIGFMTVTSAISPSVAVRMVKAVAKGNGIGLPHGDIRQLPAAFVIGTDGRIAYSYYGRDPADHPEAEEMLSAIWETLHGGRTDKIAV